MPKCNVRETRSVTNHSGIIMTRGKSPKINKRVGLKRACRWQYFQILIRFAARFFVSSEYLFSLLDEVILYTTLMIGIFRIDMKQSNFLLIIYVCFKLFLWFFFRPRRYHYSTFGKVIRQNTAPKSMAIPGK